MILEQQVMHRPEFVLRAGRLCCLCCQLCVWMRFRQGKVAEYEAHALCEAVKQHFDCRERLSAHRTFEISILQDGDPCCFRTFDMVRLVDGYGKLQGNGISSHLVLVLEHKVWRCVAQTASVQHVMCTRSSIVTQKVSLCRHPVWAVRSVGALHREYGVGLPCAVGCYRA